MSKTHLIRVAGIALVSVFALAGAPGSCNAGPVGHGGNSWNVIHPMSLR